MIVSPHMCGDVAGWEEQVVNVFVDNLADSPPESRCVNLVDGEAGFGVG